jgi:hypothetical protein
MLNALDICMARSKKHNYCTLGFSSSDVGYDEKLKFVLKPLGS